MSRADEVAVAGGSGEADVGAAAARTDPAPAEVKRVARSLQRIRGAALDAIIAALREAFAVQRCTLRLDDEGELFPVRHESSIPPASSLIGDRSVALRGQPVAEALLGGAAQVIQPDTRAASEDPAFLRMLELYGGLGAQIVTAVRCEGRLVGIISLHQLGGPRAWSTEEAELAQAAADLVARILDVGPPAGSRRPAPARPGPAR